MEEKRSSCGDIYRGLCTVKWSSVFQSPLWPNYVVLCREEQVKPCSLCFLPLEMMLLPPTSMPPVWLEALRVSGSLL